MSHTYVSGLVDLVFSTKERRSVIAAGNQERLWSFLGGIARRMHSRPSRWAAPKITCMFFCHCLRP